ncbi:hypothetical protein Tco_0510194, partial [Tanacetum coccineum]
NDSVYIQSWEYDDGRVVHYAQEAMLVSGGGCTGGRDVGVG